jgi:hypothetical protein
MLLEGLTRVPRGSNKALIWSYHARLTDGTTKLLEGLTYFSESTESSIFRVLPGTQVVLSEYQAHRWSYQDYR